LHCNVLVPQFPTPKNQNPKAWMTIFDQYKKYLDKNTILIGHSLGGTFLLRILEKYTENIKVALIIASPIGILPIKNYETDKLFLNQPFNWEKIKKHCKSFFVFHSDNDPFVCLKNGEELASKLGTNLNLISDAGHFNEKAGYTKFEELLQLIKRII